MLTHVPMRTDPDTDHRDYEKRAREQQERVDSGAGPRPLDPDEK